MDRDFGLVPFWGDQRALERWLLSSLGRSALVVRYIDELGPEDGVLDSRGRSVSLLDGAIAGLPVLALTDLGWYRGLAHQRAWLRVGRRLRRAGQRIHALVPVPAARWTRALARVWSPMPWERPTADQGGIASGPNGRRARVERLLAMAACAHRLEPGLLRALRLSLPREAADLGTEADAWLHEDMAGCFPSATAVRSERVEALRAKLTRDDAARVRDALRAWHWHRSRRPELWHSEALSLERTMPGIMDERERERAEVFVEQLGERARRSVLRGDEAPARLREWLDYVEARAPRQVWSTDTRAGRGLQIAWWATHGDRAPPDPDPSLRALVRPMNVIIQQRIELWHVGRRLGAASGSNGGGSPVAMIEAADEFAYVVQGNGTSWPIDVRRPEWIEGRPRPDVEVRTDRMTLCLSALERPRWARAIGRDRFGLWAELRAGEIAHRMRWIAPGRFVMGSPEDEPGRYDWEGPQHEVVITRGFWMGETPVTQALWRAVTGEEPSHFKGAERPVESVSWEDCERMLKRLNEMIDEERGERFRLPTEAEWEYACRAGTETATYVGEIEIRGDHNAPILDKISWYGGNSGVDYEFDDGVASLSWLEKQHHHIRAGTRRVGQKLPNPWGLYDMLGNVWEWCDDCWDSKGGYSGEFQQDPAGPASAEGRVVRGGSWDELAGGVRAACRDGSRPGSRGRILGLRLVRAQPRGNAHA
ncbi:formylglycine-generating enzyme family protein [Paraliomyxa miuraensis]|uniref:formylglycine-generating enzyme family protein n=1 Tax=Paraliomyxa miuraensis TaxID=376150 RepID=UPI002259E1A0|nr:formylglycine-generating enzyme family protein [Paraliomyxa miuraensis]